MTQESSVTDGGRSVTIVINPEAQERTNFDGIDEPRDRQRTTKKGLRAETVGLTVVIIIVWGLLLLPVIFYHLRDVSPYLANAFCIHDE